MDCMYWTFVVFVTLATSAFGQCPSGNDNCRCLEQDSVIRVFKCENLGQLEGLPYLGETDDIIQVIQISSSTVQNIYNNSFPGLKTRTLDVRSLGIKHVEVNAFFGLGNYIENLYLADNEIETVPSGLFSDMVHLRTLTLDRNLITTIENDLFQGMLRLTHLGLETNNIGSLNKGVFDGLTNLKYVYLQHNLIQELPTGLFDSLENMQELNLIDNRITNLASDVFSMMPLMEELRISSNLLVKLPENIFDNNKQLKTIDLDSNQITSNLTNRHFVGPRNLELLDLSFNNMTHFHPSTFHNLKRLKKLYLNDNRFSILASSSFEGLNNIEELNLQQNFIRSLPINSFIGMPNLKHLDISRNKIKKLGFGIFDPFGHLKTLDISRNEIDDVDYGPFITLRSLEVLDVSYNKISIVSRDWFSQDEWQEKERPLKELYLHNNVIKHVDHETFWPLKKLEKLDLSVNRIFNLNETTLMVLSELTEIGIHSNPLHNISKGLFSSLTEIRELNISHTCLTEIVPFTFDGMTALEKLDLNNGFISTIYPESFSGSNSISTLSISYNNLTTLEHPAFNGIAKSLEVLGLDHNALTMEGLADNLDSTQNLRVLDLSYNRLQNIYGVANIQNQGVLLKIMGNPILCDCRATWLANYQSLVDYENVVCDTPDYLEGDHAVCFQFPQECSQEPVAQMYTDYCANLQIVPTEQPKNSSNTTATILAFYSVKTLDDYTDYCVEPEVPIINPQPDNGGDGQTALPDPLEVELRIIDKTTIFAEWTYQNNSRIIGYKVTHREFAEDDANLEKLIVNVQITNYTFENLSIGSNFIICVDIMLDDDSTLSGPKSCREVSIYDKTSRPPSSVTPAGVDDGSFPIVPVIGACIAVVIVLVIILAVVILCLKRKPKKDEYVDDKLRDKMGMWVNTFNYNGGVNEQVAEQTTVEVDIFAPLPVTTKKKEKDNRKGNGHIA